MSITIDGLRLEVQNTINRLDKEMYLRAGIIVVNDNDNDAMIFDATRQTDEINWTTAYHQRTLTFLNTALTLLEIFSESSPELAIYVQQLQQILEEMDNPRLWQTPKRAQANFGHFIKKMSGVVEKGTASQVLEKDFNNANGWISMEKDPYTIQTRIRYEGEEDDKEYVIKSEPFFGLTEEIIEEFRNREGKIWYENLTQNTKKICDYYADKIADGELHQLPPALRGLIPGLKNSYRTSVWLCAKNGMEKEELVHFYHAATLPMGSEKMPKEENIRLTKLNYAAAHEDGEILIYTTLVSELGDIFFRTRRDIKNVVKKFSGEKANNEEFIDRTIAYIAKLARRKEKGEYHTNVCLNAARLVESFSLDGFSSVLEEIRWNIYNDINGINENRQLKNSFKETSERLNDLKSWNRTKILKVNDRDPEVCVYDFLTIFADLIHQYNKTFEENNSVKKIRWIFSCASGQNRTQILAFMIVLEAIYKNSNPHNKNAKKDIASKLAASGHWSRINGPYDYKCGVRSKSASSFPKSIRLFVEALILPLADTKRADDTQYKAIEAEEFLNKLDNTSSKKEIDKLWGKFIKRSPGKKVLIEVFDELLSKKCQGGNPKGYENTDYVLRKMLDDDDIQERLMSSEKHFRIISFLSIVRKAMTEEMSKGMTYEEMEKHIKKILKKAPYSQELKILLQIYIKKEEFLFIHKLYHEKESRKIILEAEVSFDQLKENVESSIVGFNSIEINKENNNKIEIVKEENILVEVEPTRDKKAVTATIHKHERENIYLAVQIMVDVIPKDKSKEIYITVSSENDPRAKKLMLQYACAILTHRAIPILVKNGKALTREDSKLKLLEIAQEEIGDNMVIKGGFEYDLMRPKVYEEIIKDIEFERKEDILYLEQLEQDRNLLVNDVVAVCDRLIKITFLNKNLSQPELIEKIVAYKESLKKGSKLDSETKEELKEKLKNLFADYLGKPEESNKQKLIQRLVHLIREDRSAAHKKGEEEASCLGRYTLFAENRKSCIPNADALTHTLTTNGNTPPACA